MSHSTALATLPRSQRTKNPLPVFKHQTGRWAKKVAGRMVYFGKVADDPTGQRACDLWQEQQEDLKAGRVPRPKPEDAVKLHELCNDYLRLKDDHVQSGDITPRTFDQYEWTCKHLTAFFGRNRPLDDIQPKEFRDLRRLWAERMGPVALRNYICYARSVFKFAYDEGLIKEPMKYGRNFDVPSKKTLRRARAEAGPRMFTPAQIKLLLKHARPAMKAMILLGLNGGLGNTDCGLLTPDKLDLDGGWLNYPRPKTGVNRRIPLWPETVKAIREYLPQRPEPLNPAWKKLLFVGPRGQVYESRRKGQRCTKEFTDLCTRVGITGRSFYDLRRNFETLAEEGCNDQAAVSAIMGHVPNHGDMSATYRQRMSDERLLRAVNSVRTWVFGKKGGKAVKHG